MHAYEQEVTGSHLTLAKKFLFLGTAGLGLYNRQPTDTTSNGPSKVNSGIEVHLLIPWPAERKGATFCSRYYPQMVSTRRRFYSKCIRLGALASEAARLLMIAG